MDKKQKGKISYEQEADVLTWELDAKKPIDYAEELGNVVVHFDKHNAPILIEILEASKFLQTAKNLISGMSGKKKRESLSVRR